MSNSDRWLLRRPRTRAPRARIFCLPHAGSGAGGYGGWVAAAPADWEVVVVRLPGRENRIAEQLLGSAEQVADALVPIVQPLLGLPYVVFGYSMGALVAYELTRRLVAADLPLPRLLAAGGAAAPHLPRTQARIHAQPLPRFIESVRALGGTDEAVLANPELLALLAPVLRADLELVETYRHHPGPKLPVPIVTLRGDADPEVDAAGAAAWAELTTLATRHLSFPGGHFFIAPSGDPVLPAIIADPALSSL